MTKAFRTGKSGDRHGSGKPASPPGKSAGFVDRRPTQFREADQKRAGREGDSRGAIAKGDNPGAVTEPEAHSASAEQEGTDSRAPARMSFVNNKGHTTASSFSRSDKPAMQAAPTQPLAAIPVREEPAVEPDMPATTTPADGVTPVATPAVPEATPEPATAEPAVESTPEPTVQAAAEPVDEGTPEPIVPEAAAPSAPVPDAAPAAPVNVPEPTPEPVAPSMEAPAVEPVPEVVAAPAPAAQVVNEQAAPEPTPVASTPVAAPDAPVVAEATAPVPIAAPAAPEAPTQATPANPAPPGPGMHKISPKPKAKPAKPAHAPPAKPAVHHVKNATTPTAAKQPAADDGAPPERRPGAILFTDLGLSDATLGALESMGFSEATPIQAETIPALLEGRDVIGQARTGTGKTAAFGVPLIEAARNGRRGIVLTPTRELATQVQKELQAIGKGSPVDVICLIGGAPFHTQSQAIRRHPQAIIVATPGRVCDHLGRGTLNLQDIDIFVLDEADEMLSMGFQDELDTIVAAMPKERQTVLFSATLAPAIEKLAKKALHDPATIRMGQGAAPDVRQGYCVVSGRDRIEAIGKILEAESPRATLLFCRTRARVEELVDALSHIKAEALHGGMGQPVRESVMRRFREGKAQLLVATDVAARGLDVNEIDLVLHDEPAGDSETYIHRMGRTGRAGRSGTSILFIGPGKQHRLNNLKRVAGKIEQYTLPNEQEMGRIRSRRVVENLTQHEPGDAAMAAFRSAIESGMDAQDIALRALEGLMTKEAAPEPEPTRAGPSALALKVGTMDQVHAGAILGVLTNAGGLRAEDVGRIDILEKMSVVEVPEDQVPRLIESLGRVRLSGRPLLPRQAEDWRFKTPPNRR